MNALHFRLGTIALITLILTILPLPELLFGIRPLWVLLLALYGQFFLPYYFSVPLLWFMGLALDVLLATPMGEHAFALVFVAWIASSKARRFRLFSIGQQMALVGFFCFFYQMMILIVDAFLGFRLSLFSSFGNIVISILLWPWIKLFADEYLGLQLREVA